VARHRVPLATLLSRSRTTAAVLFEHPRRASAAPIRAKEWTISPISVRSRNRHAVTSMRSSSAPEDRAPVFAARHGVPGPRTDAAGLTGTTWPVPARGTSNGWRRAVA
jgi:hypothetical protein